MRARPQFPSLLPNPRGISSHLDGCSTLGWVLTKTSSSAVLEIGACATADRLLHDGPCTCRPSLRRLLYRQRHPRRTGGCSPVLAVVRSYLDLKGIRCPGGSVAFSLAPTTPFLVCFLPPSVSTRYDEGTDSPASSFFLSALRTPRPLEPSCIAQEEAFSVRPTLPSTPRPRSRGSSTGLVLHPWPTGLGSTCLQGGSIWAVVLPCRPSNGEVVPDRVCRHESGRLDSR